MNLLKPLIFVIISMIKKQENSEASVLSKTKKSLDPLSSRFYWYFLNFLVCALFFSRPLFSQEIRILWTSSLEGNLSGCHCTKTPKNGLIKRFPVIEEYRKKNPNTILIETGDIFKQEDPEKKQKFILEMYEKQKYNAFIPGNTDLILDSRFVLKNKYDLPILINSSEIKKSRFSKIENISGVKIGLIGFLSDTAFEYSKKGYDSLELRLADKDIEEEANRLKKENAQFIVLVAHSTTKELNRLSSINGIDLIIGGHDGFLPKTKQDKFKNNKYVLQIGNGGDFIGELVLDFSSGKGKVKSEKVLNTLDMQGLKDAPEIDEFLKKNKEFDER